MAYLLDTDVVILLLAGDAAARQLLDPLVPIGIAISMVTYMEVLQGTIESADPQAAETAFDAFLLNVPVLSFSTEVARRCAQLRSELKQQERRVRPRALDLITAATALRHNLILVTRNVADYHDIPGLTLL
jgi:tRNA(fMet)-specific endonuclease VapC